MRSACVLALWTFGFLFCAAGADLGADLDLTVKPDQAFTLKASVDLEAAGSVERLVEVAGLLDLSVTNGEVRASVPVPAGSVSIPLRLLEKKPRHDVIVRFYQAHVMIAVDGHVDDDMPVRPPEAFRRPLAEARALSPRVASLSFERKAGRGEPFDIVTSRPVGRSVQYWTPDGHNTWVGDVTAGFYKGRFHVFYLLDRRHCRNKNGAGGHQFAHLSSDDLVRWTEHPLAVPVDQYWETIGTGTPFVLDGKLHLSYGIHTDRLTKDPRYPIGGTYAVSEDGVSFVKSGRIIHTAQNPTIYNRTDGLLGLMGCFDGVNTPCQSWVSDHLGDWKLRDPDVSTRGDCPAPFEWNGHHYIFQHCTQFAYSPSDAPGSYVDWMLPGYSPYEGLAVPMVGSWKDNRRLMVGFVGCEGYAGWLVFRELVQYQDGKLGSKWVPEIKPPVPPVTFRTTGPAPMLLRFPRADGKPSQLRLLVDPLEGKASFRGDSPLKRLMFPSCGWDFEIRNVRGLAVPYEVKVVVYYDPKADCTLFDAEIAGQRTMICRRPGKYLSPVEIPEPFDMD